MAKKSKGLFGKFMDLVTEEVSNNDTQPVVKDETTSTKTNVPTQSLNFDESVPDKFRTKPISVNSGKIQGRFNEEFYKHFQNEIEKNNVDGVDYFEFKNAYEVLSKSMPEVAALNATFQALKATSPNLTIPTLLDTAKFYLGLIDKEHQSFESQFADKIEMEVVGREVSIQNELELQESKRQEIEKLEAEIAESEEKVSNLQQEKLAEEHKLNEVKANWDFTIELVKNNINTDISNIETHLVDTATA